MNCARTDLGGGRSAMGVPTATEFKCFNQLEGAVCTTCAPGAPEKSNDGKLEQSVLDAIELAREVQPPATEKLISFVGMASRPALVSPVG